jgi:hypothetical protein
MALGSDAWRLGYFDSSELAEYRLMRSNQERFEAFQDSNRDRLGAHYYTTVVPKTLDLLEYCLRFLPRDVNVFLVLNGLEPWEQAYIERTHPDFSCFALETDGKPVLYDRVLDMLMEGNETDFGILDQDCFVIDPSFFRAVRLGVNDFAAAPFVSPNEAAGIEFPRTYFLFFNTQVIKAIREKHRLSFKMCWTLPERLEDALEEIHLGYDNFPHRSLNYFDNFQLIWAMALHDGVPFRRVRTTRRLGRLFKRLRYRIIHVGAGTYYLTEDYRDGMERDLRVYNELSQLDRERLHAAAFSQYAHMRLLENSTSEELRESYLPFFSVYGSSDGLLQRFGSLISLRKKEQMDLVVRAARRSAQRKARPVSP